jgi:hypothetical protein
MKPEIKSPAATTDSSEAKLDSLAALFAELEIDSSLLAKFKEEQIKTAKDVMFLDKEALTSMNVPVGPRSKLLRWIENEQKKQPSNAQPFTNQPKQYYQDGTTFVRFEQLKNVSDLASGQHGLTFKAVYNSQAVVIKVSKGRAGFDEMSELTAFIRLPKHENLVGFIGICPDFQYTDPETKNYVQCSTLSPIFEFVQGGR